MTEQQQRVGSWIQTFSGRQFWPLDPKMEDLDIGDIAHALSQQCRFSGHTRVPYSVAEHSVRVSYVLDGYIELARWGLLHDAAEAYLVDLPRPIKQAPGIGELYRDAEAKVTRCIAEYFGLDGQEEPSAVKHADLILLATEKRDLMAPPPKPWSNLPAPLAEPIVPWSPEESKKRFLRRFCELWRLP